MDYYLFQLLNQWAGQWPCLDDLAIFLAQDLPYFLVGFLFIWLFWDFLFRRLIFKQTAKMVVWAFAAALFSRLVIVEIIRWLFFRPRPFVSHAVNQLIDYSKSGSFPSGHAAFFFGLATAVFLFSKKESPRSGFQRLISIIFLLAGLLICLARVFAGLHYPSDVLAGALIGIFFGWLFWRWFH